jgi:hypothetical protein
MNDRDFSDLVTYYSNLYNYLPYSSSLLRELNSFQGNSNPCGEIKLPKEKKSEKPNFNQKKK